MNRLETCCIALYLNPENVAYFDSYRVECISQGIRKFVGNENIVTNIYRIQAHNSIMCGYFLYWNKWFYNDFKILLEYANLFSHSKYKKNVKIILKYF